MKITITEMDKAAAKMVKTLNKMGKAANDKCYDIVERVTNRVEEETVKRMPVDESFLEGSVEKRMLKNADITQITGIIYIPANAIASDYALYMHEMNYNLGPRSALKQATSSVKVGSKYMERALSEPKAAYTTFIYRQLKEFVDNVKPDH